MQTMRPKRRDIPRAVKKAVCERQDNVCKGRGCSEPVHYLPRSRTAFDHNPALRLRDVRSDGTDYEPAQRDGDYIDPLCFRCHAAKTHGTGATTAGTDTGKIKKERKRAKPAKRKPVWAKRKMAKRVNPWGKRRMSNGRP